MVSTRGGTRTAGADNGKELASRKKPVRKATAKLTQPATKAKTTRSKKAEPVSEPLEGDEEEDEIQVAAPPPKATRRTQTAKPEPAKRTTTRTKKDEEPEKKAAPKPAPRPTKATTTTRTTKAKSAKDEKPDLLPPAPIQAKDSRATRATRATAAKERAPPLSPKKITQVSKAAPKTAANAAKAKAPVALSKPTTRRRRNMSDENADVLAPRSREEEAEEKSAPSKESKTSIPNTTGTRDTQPSLDEEETPASSRPTTPSDGIGETFDDASDETADMDGDEEEDEEADESEYGDTTNNVSQDELCGPKTPMKRSSPRFGTQENTRAQDIGVPSNTPVRRFAVLGTQQGTPQTMKPYRKPVVPLSEVRPTTVSRARDRAMAFPELQPLTSEVANDEDQSSLIEDEDTPMPIDQELRNLEMDTTVEDLSTELEQDDVPENDAVEESSAIPDEFGDVDYVERHDDDEQMYDLDKTAVMQNEELGCGLESANASFDSNDSVIITRPVPALESENSADDHMEYEEISSSTPKPETLVWDNIRQDVTIPFDFDADMSLSRGLPQVEHSDRLSLANEFATAFESESDAIAGVEEDQEDFEDADVDNEANEEAWTRGNVTSLGRQSLDATVNLSDFIDVNSLSESRRQSKFVTQDTGDNVAHGVAEGAQEEQQTPPTPIDTTSVQKKFDFDAAVDDTTVEERLASDDSTPVLQVPFTQARDVSELDIALNDLQPVPTIPRYALPTISSRRKSLPAKLYPGTLLKDAIRPKTSDGVNIANIATPSRASLRMKTPITISRPSTAYEPRSTTKPKKQAWTPRANKTPMARTPGTSVPLAWQAGPKNGTLFARTPVSRTLFARTPGTSVPEIKNTVAKERFPGLPSRSAYEVDNAVDMPAAQTPVSGNSSKERFPAMPPNENYESQLETPPAAASPLAVSAVKTPSQERFPGLPSKETYEELANTPQQEQAEKLATPKPAAEDRYPGLPHRRTYEEHAKTAMPASRFRTPSHSPAKRPATVQKQASLRKVALKASTPMRTPLKAPAFTPGNVPMTPHPAAPLRGVVALVEVYTSDGDCATPAFAALLQRLGGKITKTFSERLTHVVYKEGSPNTLQRLRIHNKQVMESGTGREIHCVNSRWVTDCDAQGTRMPESDEAYAVEVDDAPRTAKRRRKSMEPMSLTNIGGSVFRDRKSSLGRSSLGRSQLKMDSPPEDQTTPINVEDKENSGDDGSPSTPAYLSAPNSLVQQTAPLHKVRKLDLKSQEAAKNRRLTFWSGGA